MTSTFGNLDFGQDGSRNAQGHVLASLFTCPSSGIVTKIKARFLLSGTGDLNCGIFNTSRNIIANGKCTKRNLTRGFNYYDEEFVFAINPSVVGSTDYYLAVWAHFDWGTAALAWINSIGDEIEDDYIAAASDIPNSFTKDQAASDVIGCIYATYTPSGTAHTHTPSDTIGVSDTFGAKMAFKQSLSDIINITDGISAVLTSAEKPDSLHTLGHGIYVRKLDKDLQIKRRRIAV